ncbi:phosphatase [Oceanicoccus sagamiensis]|uniref:Phosphatase n=1 Tax=Oceanicoccus sagamiensis TaxID=716816 RepID=A0A1X9NM48_9GAMM|nr:phosphatase [Oceanicoccus sagamiensis]
MNTSTITGVVFDMDGTLVDSKLDFDAMREELGFPEGQPILEHLDTLSDPLLIDNAHRIIRQHEMAGAKAASWMPGAEAFVHHLKALNIPMAILTRNMREATALTLASLAIPIEAVLTREDCLPKPHPQGLLMLAERWQMPCGNMVYIGDYLFDIEVAANANMRSCLYLNEHNRHYADTADWVIEHFDQLTAAF